MENPGREMIVRSEPRDRLKALFKVTHNLVSILFFNSLQIASLTY